MKPDEVLARRAAFHAVLRRSYAHWPHRQLEAWGDHQFDLILSGWRSKASDEALSAWAHSDKPARMTTVARLLWGRGWAKGKETRHHE